jgi:general nucleoside transport system permease protein
MDDRSHVVSTRTVRLLEETLLPIATALLIALVAGDLLILSYGQAPADVWRLMLSGTWGTAYGVGQVLYKATTLVFTGLSVAIGLRAGLFNIGAESQLAAGGFAAAVLGLALPAGISPALAIPACLLAAALAGGLVGSIPGALRARFGAHEVITTIMLNFVVLALLNYAVSSGGLAVRETLHTPAVQSSAISRVAAYLPAFHGSALNLTVLLALGCALLLGWVLFRSRLGFELRAVGLQPQAAESGGIRVPRTWIIAMAMAGALAGLGGTNFVLGYKNYYEDGFTGGAGFLGIAVALVGRNHPLGICLAALFFATLSQGGLAIHALVPKQMVEVLEGVVILAVAISVPEVRRVLRMRPTTPSVSTPTPTSTAEIARPDVDAAVAPA